MLSSVAPTTLAQREEPLRRLAAAGDLRIHAARLDQTQLRANQAHALDLHAHRAEALRFRAARMATSLRRRVCWTILRDAA